MAKPLIARDPADGRSPRERMAEALRRSHAVPIERALVGWGLTNIVVIIVQMFLSPIGYGIGVNIGNLNKYFMFSLALWIAVSLVRNAAPLRIPGAMLFLVAVQLWFTVSTVVSQVQLGKSVQFIAPDYSLMAFFLCFLQASMLSYMFPHVRVLMKRFMVGLCIVSAFAAMSQFLGFQPAIAFSSMMVGVESIENWAGQGGIRALGILPGIGLQITYGLFAVIFIACALFERKLTKLEIAGIVLLIGVMLMAQIRNGLVLMAIILIPLMVLFAKRHKREAIPYIGIAIAVLALLIFTGGERFSYMFSGDLSTFDYRREVLWPQAWSIYEQRPWFGIGVEPDFAGFNTYIRSRWSDGLVMDNGYLVALAYGGLPAVTFLALAVLAGLRGAIMLLLRKEAPPLERGYAIAAFAVGLYLGYGMFFGNSITNISLGMLYFIIAGMAMPSRPETKARLGDRTEARADAG
jgi:O-antigen ligase